MKNQYKKYLLLCVFSAVLLWGCAGSDTGEKENGSTENKTGSAAQETEDTTGSENKGSSGEIVFEGTDMEGNAVSSEVFSKSRLTMVNVWATYCSPCLSEMPELGELAQEYDKEVFQILGIVSNVPEGADEEKIELVEVLIEQTMADYPHLLLNDSLKDGLLADVTAVPTTFFADSEGNILGTVVGAKRKSDWKEIIDGFLKE